MTTRPTPTSDQLNELFDNPKALHDLFVGDEGHLRCPGSYAFDSDEAAWYALAAFYVAVDANGPHDDTYEAIDYYMGLSVNDSGRLLEMVAQNWDAVPELVREYLSEDLVGFVNEHFDYLVDPRDFDEMVDAYLTRGLWATPAYMVEGEEPDGSLYDHYDIDQCANRSDAEQDCRDFICLAWSDLWFLVENGATWASIGHDFLLTRDRHGAGFWDRGYGGAGDCLTIIAHTFGDSDFMPDGDDWFAVSRY